MINNKFDLDSNISMLKGNVNRMCLTDDLEELEKMKEWSLRRIDEIYTYSLSRLSNK